MEKKQRIWLLLGVAVVFLSVIFVYVWLPFSKKSQLRAVALVNIRRALVLPLPEGKELVLREDSVWQTCFFTDPQGIFQTAPLDTSCFCVKDIDSCLLRLEMHLQEKKTYLTHQTEEIAYYQHTHTAKDDGYQEVMMLLAGVNHDLAETDSLLSLVRLAYDSSRTNAEIKWESYVHYFQHQDDSVLVLKSSVIDAANGVCQLNIYTLPTGATFLNTTMLCLPSFRRRVAGYLCYWTTMKDSLRPEFVNRTDSLPPMAVGSPVLDALGHVRGVVTSDTIVSVGGWRIAPRLWWASLCQWWKCLVSGERLEVSGERIERSYAVLPSIGYVGHLLDSLPDGQGEANGYQGEWRRGKREGMGLYTDSLGTRYMGLWHNDTLGWGHRVKGDTVYVGAFNASMQPDGEGEWTCPTGYYRGNFCNGMHEGFGISLSPSHIVRVGLWKAGVFKGEHMLYTADRVYGIDISRYQHEIKRRHYAISWHNLRITNLGHNVNRRVEGTTNYPVSFCYIKATQGVKVKNRYYMADAAAARKVGIAVGAYHFFSPISGQRQAEFFLSVACPKRGDLPPVLDVELKDWQIQQMGGAEVMRREMLVWLRTVERSTGTKPVLYVSQNFIVKYLQDDATELLGYPIWIARYSEYKPYVRLLFWQLSCDGHVRGITGNVDVNVWNGTKEQFDTFVRQSSVVRSLRR